MCESITSIYAAMHIEVGKLSGLNIQKPYADLLLYCKHKIDLEQSLDIFRERNLSDKNSAAGYFPRAA